MLRQSAAKDVKVAEREHLGGSDIRYNKTCAGSWERRDLVQPVQKGDYHSANGETHVGYDVRPDFRAKIVLGCCIVTWHETACSSDVRYTGHKTAWDAFGRNEDAYAGVITDNAKPSDEQRENDAFDVPYRLDGV